MFRRIAFAALTAVAASALAQSTSQTTTTQTTTTTVTTTPDISRGAWEQKYDTYHVGSVELTSIPYWDMHRILAHNLRDVSSNDAFVIDSYLSRAPDDQRYVLVKALVNNYRQASMVRDEVAMARFGTDQTYAWLSYPPLTWSDTPGQNSWSSITFTDNGSTTTTTTTTVTNVPLDEAVAMTDDQSRPMRFVMSNRWARQDIDYGRALEILCSGLDETDRGVLQQIFGPSAGNAEQVGALTNSNEAVLDSVIHVIQCNAMMVHYLDRYSWYNHFDPNYYSSGRWEWGY